MKQKWLAIGISTVSVIFLILTSLSNVVGYQTVQTSQQNLIKERINQRELLFQTICDIANNKEIQRIILKSQISKGISPTSEMPVLTKNQIKRMYFIGLMLSRFTRTSRMQSMVGKYQFDNQEMQKEINAVIEKETTLNSEITQLKDFDCDCENKQITTSNYSKICDILYNLSMFFLSRNIISFLFPFTWLLPFFIGLYIFQCDWNIGPPLLGD